MSLFTGLLLYPLFIYPLGNVLFPVCGFVASKTLGSSDRFLYGLTPLRETDYTVGKGLVILIIGVSTLGSVGLAGYTIWLSLTVIYSSLATIGLLGKLIFWVGASCFPFVGLRLYIDSKSHKCENKHWLYTVVYALVIFGLFAVLTPSSLLSGIGLVFSMVGTTVSVILDGLTITLYYIWFAICWVGGFIAGAFVVVWPTLSILLVVGGVTLVGLSVLSLLGLLVAKFTPISKMVHDKFDGVKSIPRKYTYEWKNQLKTFLTRDDTSIVDNVTDSHAFILAQIDLKKSLGINSPICTQMFDRVASELIDKYFDLEEFGNLLYINPKEIQNLRELRGLYQLYGEPYDVVSYIEGIFEKIRDDSISVCYRGEISQTLVAILNEIKNDTEFNQLIKERFEKNEAIRLKKDVRDAKIEKVCGGFVSVISPIGVGLTRLAQSVENLFVSIWGFVKRFCRCFLDLMGVGWKLLKKGKKEACPYFTFNDGVVEESEDTETEGEEDPK